MKVNIGKKEIISDVLVLNMLNHYFVFSKYIPELNSIILYPGSPDHILQGTGDQLLRAVRQEVRGRAVRLIGSRTGSHDALTGPWLLQGKVYM